MYYPKMNIHSRARTVTDTFAGYDHNLKIADGVSTGSRNVPLELYDDQNLSTRQYPLLTTRPRRGTLTQTVPAAACHAEIGTGSTWPSGAR